MNETEKVIVKTAEDNIINNTEEFHRLRVEVMTILNKAIEEVHNLMAKMKVNENMMLIEKERLDQLINDNAGRN